MTETVVATPIVPVASSPVTKKSPSKKKNTVKAAKKPVAARPSTSLMVTSAIKELKERKGSSLVAIKKYLAANYQVDPIKMAPFIRKFLAAAVISGTILQVKGHYKLAVSVEVKPKKSPAVAKKPIAKKGKPVSASTPKNKEPVKKSKTTASGEPVAKKAKKTPTKKVPKKKTPVKPPPAAAKSKTSKKTTIKKKKPVTLKKK